MNKDAVAEMSQQYQVEAAQKLVPEGYKQTEVGVIPEDWAAMEIGSLITELRGGAPFKPNDFTKDGIKVLPKGGVAKGGMLKIFEKDQQFCSEEFARKFAKNTIDEKYTIVVLRDLVPSGPSIGLMVEIPVPEQFVLAQGVYGFLARSKELASYLVHYSNTDDYRRAVNEIMVGSTQVHITNGSFKSLKIPLPSTNEQTAIANALSDIDALLRELEKLITKKQAIKTATMQQLLTGRTRLPQFAHHPDGSNKGYKQSELGEIPEDWEVRSIYELGIVDPENLPSTTSPDYEFKYISLEQVDTGVLLGTTTYSFATAPSRARRVLRRHDVLLSTVRPNLMSHYFVQDETSDLICSTGFSVIRCFEDRLVASYLYQHLFSAVINTQIDLLITGSNYPAINSADVKKLKIQISSIEEQIAIATILADMDEEIQALEQRLKKTRQIKQGMMQELLTGRVRLSINIKTNQGRRV